MKAMVRCGRNWAVATALVGVLAVGAAAVQAATIHVSPGGNDANDGLTWPTAKASVQAGLNASAAGDEVWVAAGTYVGCITLKVGVGLYGGFVGGETDLSQRDWVANETILDGNQAGSVVTAPTGATETTRIDGFTIRNGKGSGAGIYCVSSSPAITNNSITANRLEANSGNGAGIYIYSCSPTIASNTIAANEAPGGYGGGIYCSGPSTPRITGNTIRSNIAWCGGGIHCSCPAIITNNAILDNLAQYGNGGGLNCEYPGEATVANNLIRGNRASKGGGVYGSYYATLINNTITANSADEGGGVHGSSALINNTITSNVAEHGGGIYGSGIITNNVVAFNSCGIEVPVGSVLKGLRHNCVHGNMAYDYVGVADPTGTDGNFSSDPRLAGSIYGNLHIQPDSPCMDAGDDGAVQADWVDMDGQARTQGGHVDIGADESDGTMWRDGPYAIVRVSPAGDDKYDGSSWPLAKRTVQAGIDAAAAASGEVWVAAGTYMQCINLRRYTYLYGGFDGTETSRTQRGWASNVTILDGNEAGSVVTAMEPGHALNTVDGFTIRNGSGTLTTLGYLYGGGVYCQDSSPTVRNNVIAQNSASQGAGISCGRGSPAITNNTIRDNNASSSGGGISGGVSAMIADNLIIENHAASGGGISCGYSSTRIVNNLIAGNTCTYYGGGLSCYAATVIGNTVIGNSAGTGGGGISILNGTVANTIIAFNSSGMYGQASGIIGYRVLRNNCVYGNTTYNYHFANGARDPTGTDGNISADPLFAAASPGPDETWGTADDTFADLRLLPFSPCIDAGNNADVPADAADLDGDGDVAELLPLDLAGQARFLDDPQVADTGLGTPPIVDMGAYERCRPVGDVDGDWLTDVVDLLYMVDAFGAASGDPAYDARCDLNTDGTVDVVDLLDLVYSFGK